MQSNQISNPTANPAASQTSNPSLNPTSTPEIIDGIDISSFPEDVKQFFRSQIAPQIEASEAQRLKEFKAKNPDKPKRKPQAGDYSPFVPHELSAWECAELHNSPLGHVDEDGNPCPKKWAIHLRNCSNQFNFRKKDLRSNPFEIYKQKEPCPFIGYAGIEFKKDEVFIEEFDI